MEEIWIIGVGQFGKIAYQRLSVSGAWKMHCLQLPNIRMPGLRPVESEPGQDPAEPEREERVKAEPDHPV